MPNVRTLKLPHTSYGNIPVVPVVQNFPQVSLSFNIYIKLRFHVRLRDPPPPSNMFWAIVDEMKDKFEVLNFEGEFGRAKVGPCYYYKVYVMKI